MMMKGQEPMVAATASATFWPMETPEPPSLASLRRRR